MGGAFADGLALLGVVIGVVGTLITTRVADSDKWRREQAVRWDARRLDLCAEYLAVIDAHIHVLDRLSAPHRPGARSAPLHVETAREQLGTSERSHATIWYTLCLVADGNTVQAGYQLWRAARELEYTALDLADMDVDAWYRIRAAEGQARDAFVAAARRAAGLTTMPISTSRRGRPAARRLDD
ncbi:hypothetical protein C8K30_11555 [Promicromonospora sp. AC04]|uniref:hypothetical protein n=1 Tax=Promicromonospora sp. AC04 TaxID=2135723 RepID=UPI000D3B0AD2|nr:hypothetical protein [Promicromonospora sp. AC04]PUB20844.1 hypothetical protein C8K30_11555 [Promicromonospora sp. AC04]